jgi:hypothetical protein
MAHSQFVVERHKKLLVAACWLAVVFLFATQWFVYDAARGSADPFRYYLWWSCYTWGILTPIVVTFAYHKPISAVTWKRALPLHLGASCVLVASEISIEAMLGKLRLHHDLSVQEALRHRSACLPTGCLWARCSCTECAMKPTGANCDPLNSKRS